jgi:hypothetical protein
MTDTETANDPVVQAGEHLFQYAIHRDEMNVILNGLPIDGQEKRAALEYEIQLLRIISVGWAIAYYLADNSLKTPLGNQYWEHVRVFSETLSTSASLTVGTDIDYFEVLKQRLDQYVGALDAAGEISEPAMAIGPAFSGVCGDRNDACAILAGSKMFSTTIHAVQEYLDGALTPQAACDS